MTPTNTPAPASEAADVEPVASWSYSINYGPDGEENWANFITPEGDHVANIRTHHAMRIVAALASPSAEVERLTREVERLREALEKIEAHPIRTPVLGRPCAGLPGYPACQDIARAALRREPSTALEHGKTEGGGE